MSDSKTTCQTLDNGLTVLLHETHRAPVVALQIWAQVGSADEAPDEAGLAHFHEHMLFKGTTSRGVGEIAGTIEGVGGRMNAYTSFDETVYHATLPSDQITTGIEVLVDAVRNSIFDPEEISREIGVVIEEIRRSLDSPSHVFSDAMFTACYQEHPYRLPILGTPESVESFDRDRILQFFERWYAPNNLLFVASGDFDSEQILEVIRKAFSDAKPSQCQRERKQEPEQTKFRGIVLRRPFDRTSLEFSYASVPFDHPDTPYLDLLSYVLGGGESSRLSQGIKDRERLVDQIDACSYTPLDRGTFSCNADLNPERVLDATQAISREVERLRIQPITRKELEKARTNFLALEHFERESVGSLARKLGNFQLLTGDYRSEEKYFETIRSATPEDLWRAAKTYLSSERLTAGVLLPESTEIEIEAEDFEAAVARGVGETKRRFAAPTALPFDANSTQIHSYALPNGARIYVLPRKGAPVVSARASFFGGLLAEGDPADEGMSSFLSSLWTRGTADYSAAGFARAVESLAAEIDGFTGRNSFGLTLDVTSDRLLPSLDLFSEALLAPSFETTEVHRERDEVLAVIERREDQLAQQAFLAFFRAHYGDHPYAHSARGEIQTVSKFDAERVAKHHARWIQARNLSLAIVGDVDADRVASELASRLVDLPQQEFQRQTHTLAPPTAGIVETEIIKDRAQSHLVIGFRGLTIDDEDRFALDVVTQLLAGQGGRLFLELRDRQSLAYTVSANNVEGVDPGFFALYIATAPEKAAQAEQGILDELEKLLESETSNEELARAKNYLIGNFLIEEQRNSMHAGHISLDALYGLGPNASQTYRAEVKAVSQEDVLRVARRVITLDQYTIARVRP